MVGRKALQQASLFDAGPTAAALSLDAQFDLVPGLWRAVTDAFRDSPTGRALFAHLAARRAAGAVIYPADILRALRETPLEAVKVVLLGQDPYHGAGQAHGLAFSVPAGQPLPPSLRNMAAELRRDLGQGLPEGGNLLPWARRGVLLLNTSLTVESGRPASHARLGWDRFTDALIAAVAARGRPVVHLLWGAHAQTKAPLIDAHTPAGSPHLVLMANHPSPLSARRPPIPFMGCGHFGRARQWLAQRGVALEWGGSPQDGTQDPLGHAWLV